MNKPGRVDSITGTSAPEDYADIFKLCTCNNPHPGKDNLMLENIKNVKTEKYLNFFTYRSVRLWNCIPYVNRDVELDVNGVHCVEHNVCDLILVY